MINEKELFKAIDKLAKNEPIEEFKFSNSNEYKFEIMHKSINIYSYNPYAVPNKIINSVELINAGMNYSIMKYKKNLIYEPQTCTFYFNCNDNKHIAIIPK